MAKKIQNNKLMILSILGIMVIIFLLRGNYSSYKNVQSVIISPTEYSQQVTAINYIKQLNISEPSAYYNISSYIRQMDFDCGYYSGEGGYFICAGNSSGNQLATIRQPKLPIYGSLNDIHLAWSHAIYQNKYFSESSIADVTPRLNNSFGHYISQNYFTGNSHVRISSIGEKCEDYIKTVEGARYTPNLIMSPIFVNHSIQYYTTQPIPTLTCIGGNCGNTTYPTYQLTYWCDNGWMFETNDNGLADFSYNLLRQPNDVKGNVVNGFQVYHLPSTNGTFECIIDNNLYVCFSNGSSITTYLNLKYPSPVCAQVITPACNPSTKQIINYTTPCNIPSTGWTTDLTQCKTKTDYIQYTKDNPTLIFFIIAIAVMVLLTKKNMKKK